MAKLAEPRTRSWRQPTAEEGRGGGSPSEELRTLASMLQTAAPSLFDDPTARLFLEEVERFSVTVFRMAASVHGQLSDDRRERLESALSQLRVAVEPLIERIPSQDRALLEGPSSVVS